MKINIDEAFKMVVDSAAKFAQGGRQTKMEIFSCIKVSTAGGVVKVNAATGHAFYEASAAGQSVLETGDFTVDASLFSAAVVRFVGGTVETSGNNLLFVKNKQKYTLAAYVADKLPEMPDRDKTSGFEIDTAIFVEALKNVSFAMDTDECHENTCSVHVSTKDGALRLDSLDGFRLARFTTKTSADQVDFMIPNWVVNQAVADVNIENSPKVRLFETERHIWLVSDTVKIVSSKLAGEFFDVDRQFELCNNAAKGRVVCDASQWKEMTKIASLVKQPGDSKQKHPLILEMLPDEGKIAYCMRGTTSEVTGEITCSFEEKSHVRIGMNFKYFDDVIRHIVSLEFVLNFGSALHPAFITAKAPDDIGKYHFIVLPVRLNEQASA